MNRKIPWVAAGIVLLTGAAGLRADDLPAINTPPTSLEIAGKFVWADLFTADPSAAEKFYTGLFGWESQTIARPSASGGSHAFISLSNGGRPIAGIAQRPAGAQDAVRGRWVGFISVPDVTVATAAAKAAGGRVLFAEKSLPQRGTQAILMNPDGTEVGLLHSSTGDPEDYAAEAGDFAWSELFAADPERAADYYRTLAGFQIYPDEHPGRASSLILGSAGYSRARVSPVPARPGAHPAWLFFVRVDNVKETAARAESLGGRVLKGPPDEPEEYWKALIADPTGGVIGIVQIEDASAAAAAPSGEAKP